jgi:type VI secretion system protein ImpG
MEDLLRYYNRELEFLRRQGGEFAAAYPKLAGRLRLSGDAIEDPHVERLIESVAFLNARTRLKLDDDFPELTESLFNVLYPHYLAPIPAMGIVQFDVAPEVKGSFTVPRGAEIDSEPIAGEPCRFRTTDDATLWPLEIVSAALQARPFRAPPNPAARGASAVLAMKLRCVQEGSTFSAIQPDRVRITLAGPPTRSLPIFELIMNRTMSVVVSEGFEDPRMVTLDRSCLEAAGFGRDQGMLPYPARSFVGYRLLTEYFAFPEKFLAFDFLGLSARSLLGAGRELDVFFYLSETDKDLERSIGPDAFLLGCVPVINLFTQRAEPIALSGAAYEYRVIPDSRRPDALEIESIDRVTATSPEGEEQEYRPFFGLRHDAAVTGCFWQSARRTPVSLNDRGTEVFISLVDREANATTAANWTLSIDTLCLNRDLPARLPFGGGLPRMVLVTPAAQVRHLRMITPFTPTRRPALGSGRTWRLLSHLALNHLSIAQGEAGAEALREILRLYDFVEAEETQAIIDSVLTVTSRRGIARVPVGDATVLAHGIDIDVTLNARGFPPGGAFLFASVLDRFFGLYAAVNAFTRLTARLEGRSGVLRTWPARTGEKILL